MESINYSLLKPEIALYLKENFTPKENLTLGQIREIFKNDIDKYKNKNHVVDNYSDFSIKSDSINIPMRMYTPLTMKKNCPIIVYYHGGGWIAGSIGSHNNICSLIAKKCECIVISIEYPLAPESKYPMIIKYCFEALQWVYLNAKMLGGDQNCISVSGDSAGGNLATIMTLMARDFKSDIKIAYQILICPVTNLKAFNTQSYLENNSYGLNKNLILYCKELYLNSAEEANDQYVSPLIAEDLTNLPNAFIITSEFDVLRDEGYEYAKRLKQSGVQTLHYQMKKMIHSSIFWPGASLILKDEIEFICELIKENFNAIQKVSEPKLASN